MLLSAKNEKNGGEKMLGLPGEMSLIIVILVIAVIVILSCINVVPQAKAYVVERLGGISGNMECRNSL